ncbi:DNA-binding protein [Streptomyces olivaceoviridis]
MPTPEDLDVKDLLTADLLSLPPTIDVALAGRAFGIGRDNAYKLARRGEFPCKVIRAGRLYRVVTADLRRELGVSPANTGETAA